MLGGLIIVVVLVFVIPPLFLISGGIVAGLLGYSLESDGEARNEGSELLECNV